MPAKKKKARDIERTYTAKQFVSKLRRLADAIENDERFRIQIRRPEGRGSAPTSRPHDGGTAPGRALSFFYRPMACPSVVLSTEPTLSRPWGSAPS